MGGKRTRLKMNGLAALVSGGIDNSRMTGRQVKRERPPLGQSLADPCDITALLLERLGDVGISGSELEVGRSSFNA